MHKKISVIALCLITTGCAPSQQEMARRSALECPSIGINTEHPDFSMTAEAKKIDSYYDCLIEKASNPSSNTSSWDWEGALIGASDPSGQALQRYRLSKKSSESSQIYSLQYQQVLWRQVLAGERKPNNAQEAWINWSAQLTQYGAANAAAMSQAAAVQAQASAIKQSGSGNIHCTSMNMGDGMTSINCN